jgi:pimeloyl-ACP methyl ester carboxylesterase
MPPIRRPVMMIDLLRVTTADGLMLDGALQRPCEGIAPRQPIDACLLLHGTGSSFYGSTLLEGLGTILLEWGAAVLRANTRGHDGISTAMLAGGGRRLQGAAYEIVDDCRHDVAAWLALLADRGCRRVLVLGHSLGAVKALYALAHHCPENVWGVAAISPPRLAYSWFCQSAERDTFLADFARARAADQAGEGRRLLEVKFPLAYAVSAAGYLDKYGPEERYNVLRFVAKVPRPVLVTYGGRELGHPAFQKMPEDLQALSPGAVALRVSVVPDADHLYTARHAALAEQIDLWLGSGR